jgi:probable F420-dependent oxidoreductase
MARHGLTLPIFGPLADPRAVADLAVAAEQAGFGGVFVWDHVLYRRDPDGPDPRGRADVAVADPWVTLAAVAAATDRVRIGPMVTPLPRRRPQVLARQVTTLDHLADGRLVLGIGLGGDGYREFSAFGDEADARTRGTMLDQRLHLLRDLWSGEVVDTDHPHAMARDVRFLPRPLQRPHPPIWVAGRWPHEAPRRRAAGADGWFPIDLPEPAALARGVAAMRTARSEDGLEWDGFEVVANGHPATDPAPWLDAGATWWLTTFSPWHVTPADVQAVIARGPATG